ncbi:YdeI/OmpD-associated family protein [Silvibacterium sp.]|uniref:YdeI/OmpD-associated family protein n=1 Tax=Silvibacterium sp. TaxID=1964179 RepID=UPI0039E6A5F8
MCTVRSMAKAAKKHFKATLVEERSGLGWTIVHLPDGITESWQAGSTPKVRGEINGFAFRTSLFSNGKGGLYLLVNKQMQKGAGVALGSVAAFTLELDEEERTAETPPELKRVLAGSPQLRRWWEKLPYSFHKWVGGSVATPKSAEARERRAEAAAETLLAMMEGERETPPILEAAFVRNPLARKGWEKMTVAQRRGHLWGIFYYKSPESRQKRAQKAIEEAVRIAQGKARPKSAEDGDE